MAKDSKEIVRQALNHQEPSRVPLDIGGTVCSGLHVRCVDGLREYYGLEKRLPRMHNVFMGMGMIEADLAEAMGRDNGVVKRALNASGSSYWNAYGRPSYFKAEIEAVCRF